MLDCKVSRTSGDKCGPGEFLVEDWDNDMEWQVPVIARDIDKWNKRGLAVASGNIACLSNNVEPDFLLRGDIGDAVRDAVEEEFAERDSETLGDD